MHATLPLLTATDFPPIRRRVLETLQVNLGYKCNQSCLHCHVAASPQRTEMMDAEHAALVQEVLRSRGISTLDLTGGAPELSPHFRDLVRGARALGVRVIDRCNLTILSEPGQEDTAAFLAAQGVEVTASLPCYSPANVDRQRGDGVFERSIAGLRQLNALGYGQDGSSLVLNLVYNPQGASLPPPQGPLEADYKRELLQHFGIRFNHLFAITNMPVQRFGSTLVSKGTFASYMQLLRGAYQAEHLVEVAVVDVPSPVHGHMGAAHHAIDVLVAMTAAQQAHVAVVRQYATVFVGPRHRLVSAFCSIRLWGGGGATLTPQHWHHQTLPATLHRRLERRRGSTCGCPAAQSRRW